MSRIFGPVIQQGYVVPNMREATRHWIEIGVGPFYVDEHLKLPGSGLDRAVARTHKAAMNAMRHNQSTTTTTAPGGRSCGRAR